jgi:hypothetical protein
MDGTEAVPPENERIPPPGESTRPECCKRRPPGIFPVSGISYRLVKKSSVIPVR